MMINKLLNFQLVLALFAGFAILFSPIVKAMDKCNYTFVYFHNDKKGPVNYSITTDNSDNIVGPSMSGTVAAGDTMKFYFGSNSSKKTIQPGGLITLKDDSGTIATVDYDVTWGGNEWACLLNLAMTINSGYKGNADAGQEPPSECISDEASANYNGNTQNSTGGSSPAVNFKICD